MGKNSKAFFSQELQRYSGYQSIDIVIVQYQAVYACLCCCDVHDVTNSSILLPPPPIVNSWRCKSLESLYVVFMFYVV